MWYAENEVIPIEEFPILKCLIPNQNEEQTVVINSGVVPSLLCLLYKSYPEQVVAYIYSQENCHVCNQ